MRGAHREVRALVRAPGQRRIEQFSAYALRTFGARPLTQLRLSSHSLA